MVGCTTTAVVSVVYCIGATVGASHLSPVFSADQSHSFDRPPTPYFSAVSRGVFLSCFCFVFCREVSHRPCLFFATLYATQ